ncbi:hypothetical protein U27_06345 [Candidatus Vecturithrix granuli]|uniref:Uncharacterized protein n=1 Tax=Vecturithrix granuli TaxID=1499967 RepID=A0A081C456_VECG1|nr:hypothetical protein U27_06345 [Candidatus Vecturithrix granuli]
MQTTRHEFFRNMTLALSHQQDGNRMLALAYWENVLRFLPEPIQIHNEILEECHRLVNREISDGPSHLEQMQEKLETLTHLYRQELSEEDEFIAQQIYKALYQQCGGHFILALAYWKNVRILLSPDALVITLAVQDLCWNARQLLQSGCIQECLDLYRQILRTFPEFLEGYINLSLILYQHHQSPVVRPLLDQIPERYKEDFLVKQYRELYQTLEEISTQFEHVPYAAIEHLVSDLRIENTFYPSIDDDYFENFIMELVEREKRFFERRRKAREQKAMAKTSQQLAKEGIALGQRVTMAKHAASEDIHIFLYDNHIRIAEVLLNNPNMTADDVLVMAQTTHVSEILTHLKNHHKWGALHNIRFTILLNPQTLPEDAIQLLAAFNLSDLAKVFHKKTLSPEVRIRAKDRIQQIFQNLSQYEKFAVIEASAGEILKLLDRVQFDLSSFLLNLLGKFHDQPDIVVNICRWKLAPANILAVIGRNEQLTHNLRIVFALLSNPKTPAETVISLLQTTLQTTAKRDLHYLLLNQHLPASVKQAITMFFPHLTK